MLSLTCNCHSIIQL